MRYRYIQIEQHDDGYGYMVADSYLSGIVEKDNMKSVEKDFSIKNKRWNYGIDDWEEFEPEPVPETLTEQEQAILDTAINVDYLVCLKDLEI